MVENNQLSRKEIKFIVLHKCSSAFLFLLLSTASASCSSSATAGKLFVILSNLEIKALYNTRKKNKRRYLINIF